MPLSSIPRFTEIEQGAVLKRPNRARRRNVPMFVLVILGLYIGFVGYALLTDEVLDSEAAPTTKIVVLPDEGAPPAPQPQPPKTAP